MDEERKYPDPLALSEAPQTADREITGMSQSGKVLSAEEKGPEIVPEGADCVTDSAFSGEEVAKPEMEPRGSWQLQNPVWQE